VPWGSEPEEGTADTREEVEGACPPRILYIPIYIYTKRAVMETIWLLQIKSNLKVIISYFIKQYPIRLYHRYQY